jgi:hypothetical protein
MALFKLRSHKPPAINGTNKVRERWKRKLVPHTVRTAGGGGVASRSAPS